MNAVVETRAPRAGQRISAEVHTTLVQFLGYEARLLDEGRFDEWLGLLDEGIVYEIPIRLAVTRHAPDQYPAGAYRLRDDLAMIRKRVERTTTGEDWSEAPPSRTVRNVGSIDVEPTAQADEFIVHSAVIVYRERAVEQHWDLIPLRRTDRVRIAAEGCSLLTRRIFLAETIVKTPNLGIFL